MINWAAPENGGAATRHVRQQTAGSLVGVNIPFPVPNFLVIWTREEGGRFLVPLSSMTPDSLPIQKYPQIGG